MSEKKFSYLFSTTEPLLAPNVSGRIIIPEEPLHDHYIEIVDDDSLDVISHSDMSWGSLEDRYVPFEILSEEDSSSTTSTSSTSSSNLSFSLLDQVPLSIDQDVLECTTSSSWSSYALDINLWNDDRAPVVKLRNLKEMLLDDLEFWGFFTDRLIGVGKSFLTKSPENGLYILSKCTMRNMSLSNISLLKHHRYLQYIDLAYNYISNLSPLEGIPYLIYLNVSHNKLETILNFSPPWYLTYVNLSYNYISNMCDISDFWSIVHLDLSHNAIENISGLQNLKYLKYLNLSYNLIEHIENLDKLNIQELNLEGNCILTFTSAVPGYGINTLPHLRAIYLGYNKLSTLECFKIIENIPMSSTDMLTKEYDKTITGITFENKISFDEADKSITEIEEEISNDKFQEQKIDRLTKDYDHTLHDHKELRVILDEHANIIVEDEHLKRKRHQERLLQRRDTLLRGVEDIPLIEELSESVSSEEILTKKSEVKQPEDMKDFYTEVIIKSRKIYLDQHMNKPGFFSLVVLTDNYIKAFNKLINFVYELYINYPLEKPKFSSELNHFSNVAIPTMVNSIVDEMTESLSSSILQRKTLLRMYGIASWKELVSNETIENSTDIAD